MCLFLFNGNITTGIYVSISVGSQLVEIFLWLFYPDKNRLLMHINMCYDILYDDNGISVLITNSFCILKTHFRCVYFSGCYGNKFYRSQCVRTGWTRLQFWVWCPTCGFKLIARWYPQCCSCYRWYSCFDVKAWNCIQKNIVLCTSNKIFITGKSVYCCLFTPW